MVITRQPVSANALRTKDDMREAFRQLTDPLKSFYSEGKALLQLRGAGAGHTHEVADLEGFSRILWGLVPQLAGGGEAEELWGIHRTGLVNGTDPSHPEYWGAVGDYDQRLVEMAAIGLGLCLVPERMWEPLDERERRNLYNWLNQINAHPCHDCNWLFFQVMVNLGFRAIGEPYDKEQMDRNLLRIDEFYLGNGWYSDGPGGHCDYYGPFAIHFYGLVYAKLMAGEDPGRCALYKERSLLFAGDFMAWFDTDGSALPYGRSLTYRFAQSAFWSAFAFAGLETDTLTPGVVKGLVLRNLRWWFKQPIFDSAGVLTVGYAYPNLVMAENYNAPGSPYWAFKTFLVLALSDDSDFWSAAEEELPETAALSSAEPGDGAGLPGKDPAVGAQADVRAKKPAAAMEQTGGCMLQRTPVSVQREPHLVLCREPETGHVTAFNAGHHGTNLHTHTPAKYEKFAYSTRFGFSVPRAAWGLEQVAADSMLALSERDQQFRVRRVNEETRISGNVLYARWQPWTDVEVQTWIVAGLPWHVRIHHVNTKRSLTAAEGGFTLGSRPEQRIGKVADWTSMDARAGGHTGLMVHGSGAAKGLQDKETGDQAALQGQGLINLTGLGGPGVSAVSLLGRSAAYGLKGYSKAEPVYLNANTNVLHPRAVLPSLLTDLEPGSHVLASVICGQAGVAGASGGRSADAADFAGLAGAGNDTSAQDIGAVLSALGITVSAEAFTVLTCEGETVVIPAVPTGVRM